jgi:DNA-binding MarR family transcriptional regulator
VTEHASDEPGAPATPWLDEGEQRFWRAWILSSTVLESRLNRDLQEGHGLSHGDYGVLVVLSEQEGHRMRMSALADELALSKSRLSHQISRMEKAALVRRDGDTSDGRGIFACLTSIGYDRLVEAAPTHVTGVRRYVVDLLSEQERAQAAGFLERVLARLRECS